MEQGDRVAQERAEPLCVLRHFRTKATAGRSISGQRWTVQLSPDRQRVADCEAAAVTDAHEAARRHSETAPMQTECARGSQRPSPTGRSVRSEGCGRRVAVRSTWAGRVPQEISRVPLLVPRRTPHGPLPCVGGHSNAGLPASAPGIYRASSLLTFSYRARRIMVSAYISPCHVVTGLTAVGTCCETLPRTLARRIPTMALHDPAPALRLSSATTG
jgi:hypothetical protein